ncbi:hypothetical protein ACFO4E_15655 [Nocardiopsis mangrovi]|uniref:Uncharacterized protein n=1 Tax=Nocardiopsis mangrovi TaxID=1179818 RepID=A0ABV9DXY7_9ACTN
MRALVSATGVNADILGLGETVGMIRVATQADMVARRQDRSTTRRCSPIRTWPPSSSKAGAS